MSVRLLNIAIWVCNVLLLGFSVLITIIAFSFQPVWVQLAFLAWTVFCAGYTLVERLRFVRRREALLRIAAAPKGPQA